MSINREIIFGLLAAAINIAGFVPYMLDILRGKTKPERAMWWIYSVLFIVLLMAQNGANAGWLLLATGSYIFSSVLIALLSIKYGYGKFHKRHFISASIAIAGLILWRITDQPLIAILLVILIDSSGFWLTLIKTWHAPHSETLLAWQMALLSYFVSMLSIRNWTFDVVIYPLYAIAGGSTIVWIIAHRRKTISADPEDF